MMKTKLPEEIESLVIWTRDKVDGFSRIEEIKPSLPCGDCGMRLRKQRIVDHRIINIPYTTWRSQCSACRLFKNPTTGEYDLTNAGLRAVLAQVSNKPDK